MPSSPARRLTVSGYVGSAPGQSTFANARVEIFKADNSPADQNGEIVAGDGLNVPHGEGRTYLGFLTTDANGNFSGPLTVSGLSVGDLITGTATDTSDNTSEFAANLLIEVFTISGAIYHDANANSSLDFDEIGLGDIVWAKLVQGGTVLQVVQPDSETGAYTFTNIPNGTYAVIADDNALDTDATPTAPANWQFQNPPSGSLSLTVAGADVTGRNLGLVYDLLAPCECGYGNGMPLQTAISIDGNMVDWASVLSDLDNSACDAADSTDLDYKVQSTGRNLVRISFTYNATNFYMFTQRTGQNNNTQTFIYYCDADNDGLVEAGEPVIAALWQGNNGTVDMEMYAYQPDDPAGDPLVDADGYADGYSMPGTLSFVRDLSDGGGDATGTQMEWAVSWADLGVTPGSAMAWHTSSTNVTPGASSLPNQVDDNLGGCGGQCAGSNQFGGVEPSPVSAALDAVTYLYHQIENTGNANDAFDLSSSDTGDFAIVSYTYYEDVGVVGLYEDGIDLLLTDTTGSGTVDTGIMVPGQTKRIIVAALLPASPVGTTYITTTATSNFEPGCGYLGTPATGSVIDTLFIPVSDVQVGKTDGATGAVPGTNLTYTITVTNAGPENITDVAVVDTFDPAIFDVAAISWTCAITNGTGSCAAPGPNSGNIATFVDLNVSAVATFTVTAPILSSATGTISNTATATLTVGEDPNTANNSATDDDTALAGFIELSAATR